MCLSLHQFIFRYAFLSLFPTLCFFVKQVSIWRRGDLANPRAMYCNVADLSFWSQLIPVGQTNKQENLYNSIDRESIHEKMRFSFHNFSKRKGILHLFNTAQSSTPLPNYKKDNIIFSTLLFSPLTSLYLTCRFLSWLRTSWRNLYLC